MLFSSKLARRLLGIVRGILTPSCRWFRMWRKANAACFPTPSACAGFTKFQALLISVSGTSRLEKRGSREVKERAPWGDLLAA